MKQVKKNGAGYYMKIKIAIMSEKGGRKHNEDYCAYGEKGNYFCAVLADGLGGHTGGDFASKFAAEGILEAFKESPGMSREKVADYLYYAKQFIQKHKSVELKYFSVKTTLVIFITDFEKAVWAHVGDSRLYHFLHNQLVYQTKDHSVPQIMANAGEITAEQIRSHEDRNRLTKVFDEKTDIRFEFIKQTYKLKSGDVFLLCSDGLWEYVHENDMEEYLKNSEGLAEWLKLMEKNILKKAEEGHDNYSAVGIEVE